MNGSENSSKILVWTHLMPIQEFENADKQGAFLQQAFLLL